jgi:hypothetical protein
MVVIFKTREISRGACKLTRTPTLIKKKKKKKKEKEILLKCFRRQFLIFQEALNEGKGLFGLKRWYLVASPSYRDKS